MSASYVSLLVEGLTDEIVLRQIIARYTSLSILTCYGKKGNAYIRNRIHSFQRVASRQLPIICLIDLDQENCAVTCVRELAFEMPNENFILRVAITELESWLIADVENFSRFINAPQSRVPYPPDECPYPKEMIINLARKYSRKMLREDLVPAEGSSAKVGKAYVNQIARFVQESYNLEVAASNSPSLRRAITAIQQLDSRYNPPRT